MTENRKRWAGAALIVAAVSLGVAGAAVGWALTLPVVFCGCVFGGMLTRPEAS